MLQHGRKVNTALYYAIKEKCTAYSVLYLFDDTANSRK